MISLIQRLIPAVAVALFSLSAQAAPLAPLTSTTFDDLSRANLYTASSHVAGDQAAQERVSFNTTDAANVSWANSVALGANQADVTTGSVTTPIPEPQTYALMLAGIGVLALTALRRRRAD